MPGPRRYGAEHTRMRQELVAAALRAGGAWCAICGCRLIGAELIKAHLAHDDADPRRYRGLAHARCNLRDAALLRERRRRERGPVVVGHTVVAIDRGQMRRVRAG